MCADRVSELEEREREKPVVFCPAKVTGPHPEPSITRQRRMEIKPNIKKRESRDTKWLDRERDSKRREGVGGRGEGESTRETQSKQCE